MHQEAFWKGTTIVSCEILRNRCDSNEALCTLNRLHQESGERQFRPIPFRKYQHWHQSSSSSFQLVAMEWFLVKFIVIENDDKWGCMQNDMGERWNQFCLVFGWNLWQTTFKNKFLLFSFCCNCIVYKWRRFAATDGVCKENTSEDPFSHFESPQGIREKVKNE